MTKFFITVLCIMLCLVGIAAPAASAAVRLTTSGKASLVSCLQQEYLMRDTYQNMAGVYPTLTAFGTVAQDEVAMIATLKNVFDKYRIAVPADAQTSAVRTLLATATSISNADAVAINLEQSTVTLMTQLSRTADNSDVANVVALIKATSLGSHTTAFAAEQKQISASAPAPIVPAPTMPEVPEPSARPFPAPVTTHTVSVPASIDSTGSSDVSTALMNFIYSIPAGSLINFPSTAVYRIDKAVFLNNRHNLILNGNGCTLKYTSVTGTTQSYSLWYDEGSGSDIWIRDFMLVGSSTHPGVYTPGTSPTGGEYQHGFVIHSNRFEISGCTISAVWGDGFLVDDGASSVWIHDNHVVSAGRNGLAICSGTDIVAENNAFDKVGYHVFDIEPYLASQVITSVTLRLNTAGTYGKYFFNAVNIPQAKVDGITVNGNTATGSSISAYLDSVGAVRITHISFTNNTAKMPGTGPIVYCYDIDGLTITGNIQPLATGVFTWISGCTGVVTS